MPIISIGDEEMGVFFCKHLRKFVSASFFCYLTLAETLLNYYNNRESIS